MTGKRPDYKGDGIAVWVSKDKNGKTYLSINLLGSIHLAAFKNEPKPESKGTSHEESVYLLERGD